MKSKDLINACLAVGTKFDFWVLIPKEQHHVKMTDGKAVYLIEIYKGIAIAIVSVGGCTEMAIFLQKEINKIFLSVAAPSNLSASEIKGRQA